MIKNVKGATFAGRFYPSSPASLKDLIDFAWKDETDKFDTSLYGKRILGGIVPHAGYIYSSSQAIHFYNALKNSKTDYDTAIILNPNHTGLGNGFFNISDYDYWVTPLGKIEVDKEFSDLLEIEIYNPAHDNEHSGEVQLPLLQYFYNKPIKIVVITINKQSFETSEILARKIFHAEKKTGRSILIIASSDFTHYETPEKGFEKDQYAVDAIMEFDSKRLCCEVKTHNISACGFGTIATLINYAKLKSTDPKIALLKRGHSGEVHISREVVDYISFLCFEKSAD